ncbi:MAG: gliding motility-associated C-terminal domain-containing protein [Flavobacteriales bacterium]
MPKPPSRAFSLLLIALAAMLLAGAAHAQPPNASCAGALTLCAAQPRTGNNTGADLVTPGFCPGTAATLWYTFTTNSVGGVANVSVTGIDCPALAGRGKELNVVVLSGDGSCAFNSFHSVSPCARDTSAIAVTTDPLSPSATYWLLISGVAGGGATQFAQCGFSVSVSGPGVDVVNVDFDAGPDLQIAEGQSVALNATGGTTYLWTPNSGLSGDNVPDPIAQPQETTVYTVGTTIGNCAYFDQVTVEVVRLIQPMNMFTPNGDGINDVWEIPGIATYPQADVSVYDRWGQRVYHDVGYRVPFDGHGLPAATYYWHIDLNRLNGRSAPYTGYLTLVR